MITKDIDMAAVHEEIMIILQYSTYESQYQKRQITFEIYPSQFQILSNTKKMIQSIINYYYFCFKKRPVIYEIQQFLVIIKSKCDKQHLNQQIHLPILSILVNSFQLSIRIFKYESHYITYKGYLNFFYYQPHQLYLFSILILIRPQPIQLMIRKISQKALNLEEKAHRIEPKVEDNQYYLPQPNIKYTRPLKEDEKEKPSLKLSRKASQNGSLRTYSIALFKPDIANNDSKELTASTSAHGRLKVESRKIRSSSHSEALHALNSKSALKLQLNRKDHPVRRINLKLETPTKKPKDQKEPDYDSYYNNGIPATTESKTVRAQNKTENSAHLSGRASKGSQFSIIYTRCFKLIEDYQQQLEQAKRENGLLLQQNRRLRGERGP